MSSKPAPRSLRRRSRRAAGVAFVLVAGLLGGCGVRLETPPPVEPLPDAAELVRRTAVYDALEVAELAAEALESGQAGQAAVAELTRIIEDTEFHVISLGGVYVSGIESEPEIDLPIIGYEDPPEPATVADVVSALTSAAGRNRTAANHAADDGMARLLASIGTAQAISAIQLAQAVRLPLPDLLPVMIPAPAPPEYEDEKPDGEEDLALPAAINDYDEPEYLEVTAPYGLAVSDYQALVLADDSLRFVLEVFAARTEPGGRAPLLNLARFHRERAQDWARLAGIAETEDDPRAVAYLIPHDADLGEIMRSVLSAQVTDLATLVGTAYPGTREVLIALLLEITFTYAEWGGTPVTFPGMPELSDPAILLEDLNGVD